MTEINIKTILPYANNNKAKVRFFLDDFPTSNLTVNYSVSGSTSKVNISNNSIVFTPQDLSKELEITKIDTVAGVENVTINIEPSVGYTINSFNSSAIIQLREDRPLLAFPTAKGAGAYTSGGRGGTVIHVTNLNDSGVGSFREALTSTGVRTIVFDVSGTIQLNSPIFLNNTHSNVTIAGQTAPNGGITIEGQTIGFFKTNDVIVRHIRVVSTHWLQTAGNAAALTFSGGNNVIVDHISGRYVVGTSCISFQDDNDTTDGQGNVTVQHSIFGDSTTGMLMGAVVQDGRSSLAGTNSCLNNLFINISHRFPNVSGNADAEVINNVVYNYLNRLTNMFNNSRTNIIGNYYKGGQQSVALYGDGNRIATYLTTNYNNPQAFVSENRIESVNTNLVSGQDNWSNVFEWYTSTEINYTYYQTPFKLNNQLSLFGEAVTIQSANDAYTSVLNDVGANKTLNADGSINIFLDSVDTAYIEDVLNGTSNTTTPGSYLDNRNASVLTYPILPTNTRDANYYDSNPHIPEVWFQANVPNGEDHNDLAPSGYTWIEEFLNQVDNIANGTVPVITLIGNAIVNLNVGDTYLELGATATDAEDGDLTGSIIIGGDTIDSNTIGTYVITYNVQDLDSNNAVQKTRTVVINSIQEVELSGKGIHENILYVL